MPPAHVRECFVSVGSAGKPVKGFPVFRQQALKRIVVCQAHTNAMALFAALWGRDDIMWIAEHEVALEICVGVDFRRLLRPNSL